MAGSIPSTSVDPQGTTPPTGNGSNYRGAFGLLTVLFFMWGFITVVNDPLIAAFKKIFQLSAVQASLVQFAFFIAFFVVSVIYFLISSTSGSDPINRLGYKRGMSVSLLVCSLGCFAFYPAALAESYPLFLVALFILASGIALLQICANPYAAIMGDKRTASSRLNFAQGLNSLGTTIAPLTASVLIFEFFTQNSEPTLEAISSTYLLTGSLFLIISGIVAMASMPAYTNPEVIEPGTGVLRFPQLAKGIPAIFCYVGAEVTIGSFMMLYMEKVLDLPEVEAGAYLAFYWGGIMIGRLLGAVAFDESRPTSTKYPLMAGIAVAVFLFIYGIKGLKYTQGSIAFEGLEFQEVTYYLLFLGVSFVGFVLGKSNAARTLSIFAAVAIGLLLVGALGGENELALWALLSIGLFNSIMWSNIFTLAIKDLGKYTSQGSSLLIMAIVGGAFLPILQGFMIDKVGVQLSFLTPVLCYLYILYYGVSGHKGKTVEEVDQSR